MTPGSVDILGLSAVINLASELIVPWMKENKKRIELLAEGEKLAKSQMITAELLKSKTQEEKTKAETEKIILETKRLELENQLLRLELESKKIALALEILNKVNPNLTEDEKKSYLEKLIDPLTMIINEVPE